jgi:transposase
MESEALLGLPGYQITEVKEEAGWNRIRAVFTGGVSCPDCQGTNLRTKDKRVRRLRHENWGERRTVLERESRKFQC